MVAQIGVLLARAQHVLQQPVAQTAAGLFQALDAQQIKQRPQHAQAATNDGFAVLAHTGQAQPVGVLGGK